MNFVVDDYQKQHWNDQWYKRGMRGKVIITLLIIFLIATIISFAWWSSMGFFNIDEADLYNTNRSEIPVDLIAAFFFFVSLALSIVFACVFPAMRNDPKKLSHESITINDGWLKFTYHRPRDLNPNGRDVAYAYLPECTWAYHAPTGKIAIRGNVREYHYDDPSQDFPTPTEQMRYADMLFFYPYFNPDLNQALLNLCGPEDENIMHGVH